MSGGESMSGTTITGVAMTGTHKPQAKVAVFMGGISSEHDVSLRSGAGMLRELDPARYIGYPVLISRDNVWMWPMSWGQGGIAETTFTLDAEMAAAYLKDTGHPPENWVAAPFPRFASLPTFDIALLALHGVGGEDGRLQGFFELAGMPFTGSGSYGSALAMDKIVSKHLYAAHGIPTAPFRVLDAKTRRSPELAAFLDQAVAALGLPLPVKHPKGGSSLGMGIARSRAELENLVRELDRDDDPLLLEAFLKGREVTCGVLEGKTPSPFLSPTEIRPRQDAFFNYEAKYQAGRTEEITPAPFDAVITAKIQSLALQCHQALRLSVYSRTDMMVVGDDLFVLETNNLPGFTPTSILPQQAQHAGLSYRDLLSHILDRSLARFT
jgi:D-alanine-D-alanine ligase